MKNLKNVFVLLIALCSATSLFSSETAASKPTEENLFELNFIDEQSLADESLPYRWTMLRSLAAGLATGAFTGIIAQKTEHYCWPIAWYLSAILRAAMISSITDVARYHKQNANAPLLYTSSWVSSWVAYILALEVAPPIKN